MTEKLLIEDDPAIQQISKTIKAGDCKLCLEFKELQSSHLLPKSSYRILKKLDHNQPPAIATEEELYSSDDQIRAHLLCQCCEHRFHEGGEDWIMRWVFGARGQKVFPFFDLLTEKPAEVNISNGPKIYYARQQPKIKLDALGYFALSIFWRGSVHEWQQGRTALTAIPKLEASRQEQFRRYLMGEIGFPQDVLLQVRAIQDENVRQFVTVPYAHNGGLEFLYLGFSFRLIFATSSRAQEMGMCSINSAEGPIVVSPLIDKELSELATRHYRKPAYATSPLIKLLSLDL